MPRFDLRRLCLCIGAFGAGLLLGSQLRHYTVETVTGAAAESVQRTTARTDHDSGVEFAPGRPGDRPPRVAPDSLSFSRHQWSKMLRHKESFCVPLDSYLDETEAVPIFEDISIIGRLFRPPMPKSLKEAAALFGWDEKQLESVAAALAKFARELAAAERIGTRIDYPNSGGVRFDFSDCQPAREAAVAQFKQALTGPSGRGTRSGSACCRNWRAWRRRCRIITKSRNGVSSTAPGHWSLQFPGDQGSARAALKQRLHAAFDPATAEAIELGGDLDNFFGFWAWAPEFKQGAVEVSVTRVDREDQPDPDGPRLSFQVVIGGEAHDRQGGIGDFADDYFLGRLVEFLGSPDEIAKAAAVATRAAQPPGSE